MSLLKFENLTKSFDKQDLFKDISFTFPDTGFISILGSSGSGKTTLLYILLGLEEKNKGKVFYQDKELIKEKDYLTLRNDAFFVFQEYGVINYLSSKDNLFLGGYDVQCNSTLLNEELYEKKVMTLSGGEKQRLALIKALETHPKIIFCDEPTGALDEKNGETVLKLLKKASKDALIIMVSHNLDLVNRYSDIILKIDNQKLEILKNNRSLYQTKNKHQPLKRNILKEISVSFKSFFNEKVKIILSLLSLILSLAAFIMLLNLNTSSEMTIKNNVETYADFKRIKVSQIESNQIEGTSFSITKTLRPNRLDLILESNDEYEVNYNLDYFLSSAEITYQNEKINIALLTFPFSAGLEDIRMNKAAEEVIFSLKEKVIIKINQTITTLYNSYSAKDEVNLVIESNIHYVYDEFSFLNYPCLFISHDGLENHLKNVELKNFSKLRGIYTSLYDRYTAFSDEDDALTSYSLYLDIYQKDNVLTTYNRLSKIENLSLESRAIQVYNSLKSSFTMIQLIMSVFSIGSIILTLLLIYLLFNSIYEIRKKEFALYKTYGYSFFETFSTICVPFLFYIIMGFFFSLLFYKGGIKLLNKLLFNYFAFDLFSLSFSLVTQKLTLFLGEIILSLIFSLIYVFKVKKIKVSEVIKSE